MSHPRSEERPLVVPAVVDHPIDAPIPTLTYADAVRTPSAEASKARFPEDTKHINEGKV